MCSSFDVVNINLIDITHVVVTCLLIQLTCPVKHHLTEKHMK